MSRAIDVIGIDVVSTFDLYGITRTSHDGASDARMTDLGVRGHEFHSGMVWGQNVTVSVLAGITRETAKIFYNVSLEHNFVFWIVRCPHFKGLN